MIKYDLTGNKVGRLSVLHRIEGAHDTWWLCVCECGTKKKIASSNLRSGRVISCGCYISELTTKRNTKHGLSKKHKRAFHVWNNMMQRCYNIKHPRYNDWGGRGIKVCHRWHKFENFLVDMGDPPPGKQIDRKNNDRGYSKKNCRWTTRLINMHNRRNSRKRLRIRL